MNNSHQIPRLDRMEHHQILSRIDRPIVVLCRLIWYMHLIDSPRRNEHQNFHTTRQTRYTFSVADT